MALKNTTNPLLEYNLRCSDRFPVVNCGNKENPIYLPVEVCAVMEGQPYNSKLDSNQTSNMINFAVRPPFQNAGIIVEQGLATVGLMNNNPNLGNFNLSVGEKLIKVPGRILEPPNLSYRLKSRDQPRTVYPKSGSWNMANVQFHRGSRAPNWSFIVLQDDRSRNDFRYGETARNIIEEVRRGLADMDVQLQGPFAVKLPSPIVNDHWGYLGQEKNEKGESREDRDIDSFLKAAHTKGVKLLFIILPYASPGLYKRIKTHADKTYGIHTICSVATKLQNSRGRIQYIANLATKVNLKLGGNNYIVNGHTANNFDFRKTMVVGMDVTHPSPGSTEGTPSISAMVASVDGNLNQWPATLNIQKGKEEMVKGEQLTAMLMSRLDLWVTKNRMLPENILVYRDGVSEGQYQHVIAVELPQLRLACTRKYQQGKEPRITIIICGKRHKTRFYPTNTAYCDKGHNNLPGTVVDRGVTETRTWDFYFQAHTALHGTARPCHYFVAHDEIFRHMYNNNIPRGFSNISDIIEDVTHNLSYNFGRATRSVSLCTPAYYADLACERGRCYLSDLFDGTGSGNATPPPFDRLKIHPNLEDTMFYI
ncbi:unnamed protein product [Periconia digitata]|uniref:Piwi domain-containing protein n=1 Tax=Periconia digitata TaxID=1303443 RepID=A0A9W4XD53_9PLEO|nr:unnamed protein product [Periconia digitata]